jgi:hypothetical protein
MRAIVMGTKSSYQKLGLESALFIKLGEYVLPKNQYEELELSWVGDFNEKMISYTRGNWRHFWKTTFNDEEDILVFLTIIHIFIPILLKGI